MQRLQPLYWIQQLFEADIWPHAEPSQLQDDEWLRWHKYEEKVAFQKLYNILSDCETALLTHSQASAQN